MQELLVPQRVIPHLMEKGRLMIRLIEELMGIIVGMADANEGGLTLIALAL